MPQINVIIDKLTNSIENAKTGENFKTQVLPFNANDKGFTKSKWSFNWAKESTDISRQVFKLITIENPSVIHGLLSIEDKGDHVYMHLLENAKFNIGKEKIYAGVARNLVAFACKLAFEMEYDGYISFVSKTKLVEHYKETLGAKIFGGNRMYIDTFLIFETF